MMLRKPAYKLFLLKLGHSDANEELAEKYAFAMHQCSIISHVFGNWKLCNKMSIISTLSWQTTRLLWRQVQPNWLPLCHKMLDNICTSSENIHKSLASSMCMHSYTKLVAIVFCPYRTFFCIGQIWDPLLRLGMRLYVNCTGLENGFTNPHAHVSIPDQEK